MNKGKLHLNKKMMNRLDEMYKIRSLEAGCINNGLTQLQSIFGELIKKKISKAKGLGLRKVLSSFVSLQSAYAIMFTLSASANNNKVTRATLNFAKQTQLVKVDTKKANKRIDKDAIIKELNELIEKLQKEMSEKNKTIQELKRQIQAGNANDEDVVVVNVGSDDGDMKEQCAENLVTSEDEMFDRIQTLRVQLSDAQEEERRWTMQMDSNVSKAGMTEQEMRAVFDSFDVDGGGSIDELELKEALNKMGQNLTEKELSDLFFQFDKDGSGDIDFEEFKVMIESSWFINAWQSKLAKKLNHMLSMDLTNDPDFDLEDVLDEEEETSPMKTITQDERDEAGDDFIVTEIRNDVSEGCLSRLLSKFQTNSMQQLMTEPSLYHQF